MDDPSAGIMSHAVNNTFDGVDFHITKYVIGLFCCTDAAWLRTKTGAARTYRHHCECYECTIEMSWFNIRSHLSTYQSDLNTYPSAITDQTIGFV